MKHVKALVAVLAGFSVPIMLACLTIWLFSPNEMQNRLAKYICEDHGGVYSVSIIDGGIAHCNDNTKHKIGKIIILKEERSW